MLNIRQHAKNYYYAGHRAFLGFFYLDYAYNNPVIHVFIKVLKESLYDNPSILMESVVNGEKENSLEKGAQTSSEFDESRPWFTVIFYHNDIAEIFHQLKATAAVILILFSSSWY